MDKCANCGTELKEQKPGEDRESCPKCGSMNRIISETITETVDFTDSASAKKKSRD